MNSKKKQIQPSTWNFSTLYFSNDKKDYSLTFFYFKKKLVVLQDKLYFSQKQIFLVMWMQEIFVFFNLCGAFFNSLSSSVKTPDTTDTTYSVLLNALSTLEKEGLHITMLSQKICTLLANNAQNLNMFSTSFPQGKNLQQLQKNNAEESIVLYKLELFNTKA